ncbi:DUF402 domain-containing protein [Brevibacterium sanguinis]|uniref:DUF402 domain-containing protein n=1 Tax=Brevibacterium sanguinis TaxID=232444 RepID=UPI0031D83133
MDDRRWHRGDAILWTYINPDFPDLVDQRPVTVVADDERHLAVWLAPETRLLHQVLADGSELRSAEGSARFTAPRAQAVRTWAGKGILAVFQPDTMHSVWFFESASGRRDSYYVNIEVPFTRDSSGITTSDLVLDLVVAADGTHRFKDEDELEFAEAAGLFSSADITSIREAAQRAVADVEEWRFPFGSGYESFQPDPSWPVPSLPHDATWEFEI